MANPKRRHSKARGAKRRSHDALTPCQTVTCDNCGAAALPHRVCGACGYYKGRQVMTVKVRPV
jgi:large subunit ribosomal protein L32